jgi:hypothetical protein
MKQEQRPEADSSAIRSGCGPKVNAVSLLRYEPVSSLVRFSAEMSIFSMSCIKQALARGQMLTKPPSSLTLSRFPIHHVVLTLCFSTISSREQSLNQFKTAIRS